MNSILSKSPKNEPINTVPWQPTVTEKLQLVMNFPFYILHLAFFLRLAITVTCTAAEIAHIQENQNNIIRKHTN
jgi:hypothetical protein